jgi:TPR repeat protein
LPQSAALDREPGRKEEGKEETNMTEPQSSFWSTLPGILTAVGTVIGAVTGLLTALYSAGIIGPSPSSQLKCTAPFIRQTKDASLRDFLTTLCEYAEAGLAESQYKLANLYREGRFVPQHYAEAIKW